VPRFARFFRRAPAPPRLSQTIRRFGRCNAGSDWSRVVRNRPGLFALSAGSGGAAGLPGLWETDADGPSTWPRKETRSIAHRAASPLIVRMAPGEVRAVFPSFVRADLGCSAGSKAGIVGAIRSKAGFFDWFGSRTRRRLAAGISGLIVLGRVKNLLKLRCGIRMGRRLRPVRPLQTGLSESIPERGEEFNPRPSALR
jgi:hypothetical protein